ncbi:hypothetical protein BJX63DRAFT_437646 [Aspergillus granulosus]|uniref:F-box domain-containing protein n=1 Tax=Aspergillus granulosus TaxID=176169 RepID=A0ABR4GUD1_9EURO
MDQSSAMLITTDREFDCYCFLCCGPLGALYLDVGSSGPGDLTNRRRRVEKKRLALDRGDEFDSDESSQEGDHDSYGNDSQEEDEHREEDDENQHDDDENEDEDEDGNYQDPERHSYDPDLATNDRTDWLHHVRVLGFNPHAFGKVKAFISGPATYEDMGRIRASLDPDPNQSSTGDSFFDCYTIFNDNETGFPFHDHCMAILEKALQWYYGYTQATEKRQSTAPKLDLDALYEAASRLTGWSRAKLDLNYGHISGAEECWDSISGEEFSVSDPLQFPHQKFDLPLQSGKGSATQQILLPRVSVDPFRRLPKEILHVICHDLPGRDLKALLSASATAYHATLDPGFWRSLVSSRMPWAWEFWSDNSNQATSSSKSQMDYKRLYLCLDINTSLGFGIPPWMGDWMGITNRRRIWNACIQLLENYHPVVDKVVLSKQYGDYCSPEIAQTSILRRLFPIRYPQPCVPAMCTHFLYSWNELDSYEEVSFDTFWDSCGDLIGLGVQFGSSKRILGKEDALLSSREQAAAKSSVQLKAKSWIKGLVLHVRVGMPLIDSAVRRITVSVARSLQYQYKGPLLKSYEQVVLTTGQNIDLGNDYSASLCVRPLFPSREWCLVGLVGQQGNRGVIASLGVLECDRPGSAHPSMSTVIPLKEKLLWSSSALNLSVREATSSSNTTEHIWSNPSIHIGELVSPSGNPMAAMAAHEVFHWAAGKEGLKKLKRISARVSKDPDSGETILRGLGFSDTRTSTVSMKWAECVGSGYHAEELPGSTEEWTMQFDIDGPGGEIIEEVSVRCIEGWVKAILLKTNRDRKGILGEGLNIYDWSAVRVPSGHFIAGLAPAFSVATGSHDPKSPKKMVSAFMRL